MSVARASGIGESIDPLGFVSRSPGTRNALGILVGIRPGVVRFSLRVDLDRELTFCRILVLRSDTYQ